MHQSASEIQVRESRKFISPAGFPSSIARWAPVPLRLLVGFGFMAHGIAKL
jgi:putative oxidoreductase